MLSSYVKYYEKLDPDTKLMMEQKYGQPHKFNLPATTHLADSLPLPVFCMIAAPYLVGRTDTSLGRLLSRNHCLTHKGMMGKTMYSSIHSSAGRSSPFCLDLIENNTQIQRDRYLMDAASYINALYEPQLVSGTHINPHQLIREGNEYLIEQVFKHAKTNAGMHSIELEENCEAALCVAKVEEGQPLLIKAQ